MPHRSLDPEEELNATGPRLFSVLDVWSDDEVRANLGSILVYFIARRAPRTVWSLTPDERQELFVRVFGRLSVNRFQHLRKYKDVGKHFSGWLARVVTFAATDILRQRNRRESSVDDNSLLVAGRQDGPDSNPHILHLERQVDELLEDAYKQIDPRWASATRLWRDGLPPKKILEVEGWTDLNNKQLGDQIKETLSQLVPAALGQEKTARLAELLRELKSNREKLRSRHESDRAAERHHG